MTLKDVLDGMETVKVCVGYKTPHGEITRPPIGCATYKDIEPVYAELPGWQ